MVRFNFSFVLFWYLLAANSMNYVKGSSQLPRTSTNCPKMCECHEKGWTVSCVGKGLKFPPSGIPVTARFIDMSYNPRIVIPKQYFLQFRYLKKLIIFRCELRRGFLIPDHVEYIDFSYNLLTLNAVEVSFGLKTRLFLRVVRIQFNKIELRKGKPLLPKALNLKSLYLDGNNITAINKTNFQALAKLTFLSLSNCGLKFITEKSFDKNRNLRLLIMSTNNLVTLPKDCFIKLNKLRVLIISSNKLSSVPDLNGLPESLIKLALDDNRINNITDLSSFHFKHIRSLNLGQNDIKHIPKALFRKITVKYLQLSANRIDRLEPYSFSASKSMFGLLLDHNNITRLYKDAFLGIENIDFLSLSDNKIKSFDYNLFADINVKHLLLHNNNLSNIQFLFSTAIAHQPILITLFGNPITEISHLQLPAKTKVFISCENIHQLHLDKSFPMLICALAESFELYVPNRVSHSLQRSEFECSKFRNSIWMCRLCKIGYYKPRHYPQPLFKCVQCPAGAFYQDEYGQKSCKQCPFGKFVSPSTAPGQSRVDCKTCPDGTFINQSAGYRACFCLPGFARFDRFGPCHICKNKGILCKEFKILKQGYWWQWPSKTMKSRYKRFVANLQTENSSYDTTVSVFDEQLPEAHKCHFHRSCQGGLDAECNLGYEGPICSVCSFGYHRTFRSCAKCPSPAVSLVTFLSGFFIFVTVIIILEWSDAYAVNFIDFDNSVISRSLSTVILSIMKLLLMFFQIVTGLAEAMPQSVLINNNALETLYYYTALFPTRALSCIRVPSHLNALKCFFIRFGLVIGIVLFFIFFYRVISLCHCSNKLNWRKRLFRFISVLFYIILPSLTIGVVQLLPVNCRDFCLWKNSKGKCEHKISRLHSDYIIHCSTLTNNTMTIVLYSSLAFLLSYFFFICLASKYLSREHDVDILASRRVTIKDTIKYAMGFLAEQFKPKFWYWEALNYSYKILLTSCALLLTGRPNVQYVIALINSAAFAVFFVYHQPIRFKFENALQSLISIVISLYISFDFLLYLGYMGKEESLSNIVLICCSTVLLGVVIIWLISRRNSLFAIK